MKQKSPNLHLIKGNKPPKQKPPAPKPKIELVIVKLTNGDILIGVINKKINTELIMDNVYEIIEKRIEDSPYYVTYNLVSYMPYISGSIRINISNIAGAGQPHQRMVEMYIKKLSECVPQNKA